MPFTLAHPAAAALVWPLARRVRLPLAALAIGAMAPDFEFFLHLRPLALWSHSFVGLLTFCLPAGLLVFAVWELVAREPVLHLLGFGVDRHREPRRPVAWIQAAAGVLLGAATHLVWDGFTHGSYWGADIFPALRAPALRLDGGIVPWYNVLQHVSTAVGGLVVLGWCIREAHRAGAIAVLARSLWRWLVLSGVAGVAIGMGLWNGARWSADAGYWAAQLWLGHVAVAAMLGFGLALLIYSVTHRLTHHLVHRTNDLPAT